MLYEFCHIPFASNRSYIRHTWSNHAQQSWRSTSVSLCLALSPDPTWLQASVRLIMIVPLQSSLFQCIVSVQRLSHWTSCAPSRLSKRHQLDRLREEYTGIIADRQCQQTRLPDWRLQMKVSSFIGCNYNTGDGLIPRVIPLPQFHRSDQRMASPPSTLEWTSTDALFNP